MEPGQELCSAVEEVAVQWRYSGGGGSAVEEGTVQWRCSGGGGSGCTVEQGQYNGGKVEQGAVEVQWSRVSAVEVQWSRRQYSESTQEQGAIPWRYSGGGGSTVKE